MMRCEKRAIKILMLRRFLFFLFSRLFPGRWPQTLFGKFCVSHQGTPQSPAAPVHRPSPATLAAHLPPRPSGYVRRKSARASPVLAPLARHVQDLEPHVPPVQDACDPPAHPPVHGQLDPAVRPRRQLPAPGCYFQPQRGKLDRDSISFRQIVVATTELTLPALHSSSASIIICSLVRPFTSTGRS